MFTQGIKLEGHHRGGMASRVTSALAKGGEEDTDTHTEGRAREDAGRSWPDEPERGLRRNQPRQTRNLGLPVSRTVTKGMSAVQNTRAVVFVPQPSQAYTQALSSLASAELGPGSFQPRSLLLFFFFFF